MYNFHNSSHTNITMASSSTSMTKKKNSKISQSTRFAKRQETAFKKASELSVLCGIEVCVICYMAGVLKTWPQDKEKVKDMARRYSALSDKKRHKGRVDLSEFLQKINKDDDFNMTKNKKKVQTKYPVWDPRFDNYSEEQLTDLIQYLEHVQARLQQRFQAVVESHKRRNMQNPRKGVQEQRMVTHTTSMMNHHPQQKPSNLISRYLFNPMSQTAFNQSQSLAPLPDSLMIYPNSNLGNPSGLLGGQENWVDEILNTDILTYNNSFNDNSGLTGTNEFQNRDMYSYNNLSNIKMENHPQLLGPQGSMINGLQNMNLYDYNGSGNTYGLSHQHVSYPTQAAAQDFRYGSVSQY